MGNEKKMNWVGDSSLSSKGKEGGDSNLPRFLEALHRGHAETTHDFEAGVEIFPFIAKLGNVNKSFQDDGPVF